MKNEFFTNELSSFCKYCAWPQGAKASRSLQAVERAWGLAKLEFKKLAFITKYLIKCAMV